LSQLARSPIIPLCGNGQTKIQPIAVDDLTDVVWSLTCEGIFPNDTFDIGGPEIVTIEEFLRRTAQVCYGRTARVIHIPFGFFASLLTYTEKFFYSLMPFNIGQFSVFLYDSTIANNLTFDKYREKMQSVDQMLERIITHE
jgi:NADH dehydrogenase